MTVSMLTRAQQAGLDQFADKHPRAVSVCWLESARKSGPVVRESDLLSDHWVITFDGTPTKIGEKLLSRLYRQRRIP